MRAAIVVNNAAHQQQHAAWIKAGLEKHGWKADLVRLGSIENADMVVSWSVKHRNAWNWQRREGGPVLVMERAALQPRDEWTGCGFNGLAGKAIYPRSSDDGERWERHFGKLMKPWRAGGDYVLVCGQVPGDAAIWGTDFQRWAQAQTADLKKRGWDVRYRAHPLTFRHGNRWCPTGATLSVRTYREDLAGAAFVVTFNSTAGVESVLAGVPTVTFDRGAMAWPVTTHTLDDAPIRPDRAPWAHDLAWSCWSAEELQDGTAWETLRPLYESLRGAVAAPPQEAGKSRYGRRVLVLGGAECLWADVNRALDLSEFDAVIACNDAAAAWPGELDAFVTLHPSKLPGWLKRRRDQGFPQPCELVSYKGGAGITRALDFKWAGSTTSGSSGLYAAKVALDMGFERAVLCGVPMHQEPHFFDQRPWNDAVKFRHAWKAALPTLRDKVRSMSGWTRELLGEPTAEWLAA